MRDFNGGGNRGDSRGGARGGGFQKKSWGGSSDRGEVTMHKATCSECGKTCEVPFRPTGSKPVYCNDCFGSKRDDGERSAPRSFSNDRAPRREFGNDSRPSFGGDKSFSKPTGPAMPDHVARQIGEMNGKLDRLITSLEKIAQGMTPAVKEAAVAKSAPTSVVEAVKVAEKKSVAAPKPAAKKVVAAKAVAKSAPAAKKVVANKKK